MKKEIIQKLKVIESKLGQIIESVEKNEPIEVVVVQISNVQEELLTTRNLILKDHLKKVGKETGVSMKELTKYYNLIK